MPVFKEKENGALDGLPLAPKSIFCCCSAYIPYSNAHVRIHVYVIPQIYHNYTRYFIKACGTNAMSPHSPVGTMCCKFLLYECNGFSNCFHQANQISHGHLSNRHTLKSEQLILSATNLCVHKSMCIHIRLPQMYVYTCIRFLQFLSPRESNISTDAIFCSEQWVLSATLDTTTTRPSTPTSGPVFSVSIIYIFLYICIIYDSCDIMCAFKYR
jgi:hypothetical protein